MNPLEWSGPQFLGFYVNALVITGALSWVLKRWLHREGEPEPTLLDLRAHEVALLRGRAEAVHAAVVSLARRGALGVEGGVLVERSSTLERDVSPLESAVHRAVVEGARSRWTLIRATGPRLDVLERPLEARGLLRSARQEAPYRYAPGLLPALLGLLGLVKLGLGVWRNRPVGLLVLLLMATAVVFFLLIKDRVRLTARGRWALAELGRQHEALRLSAANEDATEMLRPRDVLLAASLFGVGALAFVDAPLRDYLVPPSVSSGGGSGVDSGGGDSGGGDSGCGGGGGCGGCGGGGD
ncbi:TIGR04222 domain-containing membrane protein [Melittangium boletus]|uniref:TIGR04222 domain-containing membrane protein n=1 Tax=Melittangium boletus TaxID=83453 RepID=UPI003DA4ACED